METLTLDFETYYSSSYSLSKLSPIEYIRGAEFKVHGCSFKIGNNEAYWISGDNLQAALNTLQIDNYLWIAHNGLFDYLILAEEYNIRPKHMADTLSMARGLLPPGTNVSLDNLTQLFKLGTKGQELVLSKGLRDLPPDIELQIADYACNDADLCYLLYLKLIPYMPPAELRLINTIMRWGTHSVLELNVPLLEEAKEDAKATVIEKLVQIALGKTQLRSNKQFAAWLKEKGYTPPMRISPSTGKLTWAFGKDSIEYQDFKASHPELRTILEAKEAVSSRIEETRAERMIFVGTHGNNKMIMPLNYYGADNTGRMSGAGKLNVQNLKRGSKLRRSIKAPDGYNILVADSSQIELRVNMWFCGQTNILDILRNNGDVYSYTASDHFGMPINKKTHPNERQFGKLLELACLSGNTLVLTPTGWKELHTITSAAPVWDGAQWVRHDGLLIKGTKECLSLNGVQTTPNHRILSGETWNPAQSVVQNENILLQTLETGLENLPSQGLNWEAVVDSRMSSSNVHVEPLSTKSIHTISKMEKVPDVTPVPKSKLVTTIKNILATLIYLRTKNIEVDYLTGCPLLEDDAKIHQTNNIHHTVDEVLKFTQNGWKENQVKRNGYPISSHLMGGIIQSSNLIELTITKGMSQETSDLLPVSKTVTTNVPSQTCNLKLTNSLQKLPVYDLANCGPNNRFTILTNKGPIIVHNCGYGMGHAKFRIQAALGALGTPKTYLSEQEAYSTIQNYRTTHASIKGMWDWLTKTIIPGISQPGFELQYKCVKFVHGGIELPNGMMLLYPDLQCEEGNQWTFQKGNKRSKLYGGLLLENIIQALSRIVVFEQMMVVEDRLPNLITVSSTHDEFLALETINQSQNSFDIMLEEMGKSPSWAPDLPVTAEGGFGSSYSK